MKPATKFNLRIIVFLLIMIFVSSKINISVFFDSIKQLNKTYLIFAISYFFIYPWFGIARWRRLVADKYPISFSQSLKIYFYGEGFNLMLPSKIGDLSKSFFLKKFKICPLPYANGTVIYEKILDLLSIFIIFGFSLLIGKDIIIDSYKYILASIFTFGIGIIILFNMHFLKNKILEIIPRKYHLISDSLIDFFNYFELLKHNYHSIIMFLIFSILFWAGHFFQIYLFMLAANINILYSQVLFYMPLTILISLIPITIAGYGSREASLLFFLNDISTPENIILGSFLISLRYLIPGIIGLLLFSFSNSKQ